jgi:hypothetical protein
MIRADERRSGKPQSFGQLHLDAGDRQPVLLYEDLFQRGTPTTAAQSTVTTGIRTPVTTGVHTVRLLRKRAAGEKRPSHFHVMQQEYAPYLKALA